MNIDPSCFDDASNVRPDKNCVSFANLFLFEFDVADEAMRHPNRFLTDPSTMSSIDLEKKRVDNNNSPQESDCAAAICKTSKKQRTVSFAPDYQVIQLDDDQTEDIKRQLWYSRYDFMVFENEACLCSEAVRESASQGSFDNELDDILGLEKIIFCDSFSEYRYALRTAVMEEQALQLANEKAQRKVEDLLADTSERYSFWAREQASLYAFTLEHDLGTSKGGYSEE